MREGDEPHAGVPHALAEVFHDPAPLGGPLGRVGIEVDPRGRHLRCGRELGGERGGWSLRRLHERTCTGGGDPEAERKGRARHEEKEKEEGHAPARSQTRRQR